jgi:NADPH:quinone reductase-like Zn-dependent oxidoreductase
MNAAVLRGFGAPGALEVTEWPDPKPRPGWVTVELRAAALNWHDVIVRRGDHPAQLPQILGADGAGVRRDTGDPVVILPSLGWGDDERCPGPSFSILGDVADGTYAELVAVPEENIFRRPRGFGWAEAAALPLAGLTAYRALFSRGGLQAGETVVVLGAGSGVSTMAVALATMAGARVFVTSSSPAKLERAAELGAVGGVLYTHDAWPVQLRELAGPADLVIDSIGSTWPDSLSLLSGGGRLVNFGATGGERATVAVRPFYFSQHTILGSTMGSPRDFAALLALIAEHPDWRPAVDAVIPFFDVAAAHERMERREHFGKLVLAISDA